ncbi:hypothetical protein Zmor_004485 [Zophobas morio]|uniref:Uncharacterized protein n=1 Tax=Zophobas morio TaxID=2755281 RepID=A0AA38M008_9CUCU|nr:hypothetical protein Zmor_004485 [Zophobas morio]
MSKASNRYCCSRNRTIAIPPHCSPGKKIYKKGNLENPKGNDTVAIHKIVIQVFKLKQEAAQAKLECRPQVMKLWNLPLAKSKGKKRRESSWATLPSTLIIPFWGYGDFQFVSSTTIFWTR